MYERVERLHKLLREMVNVDIKIMPCKIIIELYGCNID